MNIRIYLYIYMDIFKYLISGAIRVEYSDLFVENCEFNDNFSFENGAIFYVYNSKSFEAQNIKAHNTTALEKVWI